MIPMRAQMLRNEVLWAIGNLGGGMPSSEIDRKSTRLNSSHLVISYAGFCLKKKRRRHSLPARRPGGSSPRPRGIFAAASQARAVRKPAEDSDLRKGVFFFNDTATTEIYTLSLHDALPI